MKIRLFPILADLCENPPCAEGISCLYVAPLKSLINDQFLRMEEVLHESGVRVFHWHGDVGSSSKTKFLKNPSGILQITPESLEVLIPYLKAQGYEFVTVSELIAEDK